MDVEALRAQFPVLEQIAYLNSGTDGPLPARRDRRRARTRSAPRRATAASRAHFERGFELQDRLRAAYARASRTPTRTRSR